MTIAATIRIDPADRALALAESCEITVFQRPRYGWCYEVRHDGVLVRWDRTLCAATESAAYDQARTDAQEWADEQIFSNTTTPIWEDA